MEANKISLVFAYLLVLLLQGKGNLYTSELQVCFHSIIFSAANGIELNSSRSKEACYGDSITFICSVERDRLLLWAVESVNSFFEEPIKINASAEDGHVLVPDPFPGIIVNVTLLSGRNTGESISSEITVIVNARTLGKSVNCSDSISQKSILIAKPRKQ